MLVRDPPPEPRNSAPPGASSGVTNRNGRAPAPSGPPGALAHTHAPECLHGTLLPLSLPLALSVVLLLRVIQAPVLIVIAAAVLIPGSAALYISRRRLTILRSLRERGAFLCPRCARSLAGLSDHGVCPGCKRPYTRESVESAWIAWARTNAPDEPIA